MTSLLHNCLDNSTYVRRREMHSLRDEVWMHGWTDRCNNGQMH